MIKKKKNNNIKKPEWLALFVSYSLSFIGSDFIVEKYAKLSISPLIKGDYFHVVGDKAIIYGLFFSLISIIMFILFILNINKYIKKKDIIIIINNKKYIFWLLLLYIYIPLFNVLFYFSFNNIRIILFIILIVGILYIFYLSYKLYYLLKDKNQLDLN